MLPDPFGLVQVEVAEPELVEGEHDGLILAFSLELDDGSVGLVWLPPFGKPQNAPGDDEVYEAHDVPEVEDQDLAAPPDVPERAPHQPARKPFDPGVGDIFPEDPRPHDLFVQGQIPHVSGNYRYFGQLGHL